MIYDSNWLGIQATPGISSLTKSSSIGNLDLITDKNFRAGTLPASSTRSTEHEAAGWVNVETGDDACAGRAGDDEERNGGMFESTSIAEVIKT